MYIYGRQCGVGTQGCSLYTFTPDSVHQNCMPENRRLLSAVNRMNENLFKKFIENN